VLRQTSDWLKEGHTVWLCTVIHTWGSAPRIPGSLLAYADRKSVGSLSGGCVEDELLQRLETGEIDNTRAHYIVYGGHDAENVRLNLPCNGKLGVLLEPLSPDVLMTFQDIVAALECGKNIHRECIWPQGQNSLTAGGGDSSISLLLDAGQPQRLMQTYGPVIHLLIIGINEVSRHLAQFALAVGYRVTVCDPRADQHKSWDISNVRLVTTMPDDTILSQAADVHSAIVAVTHDPRIDDMGLMVAFNTDAFYIGAMGSRATTEKRKERLAALGVSPTELLRLHAPIGLDIGSKTPAEIAVSILAELIACDKKPSSIT
jgi:xanthine dehydrogenase accessory factor